MINPYITRSPIKEPEGFCGRKDVLMKGFRDIVRKPMQSHCVIGERRIGKTSLLFQFMNSQVQGDYLRDISSIFIKTDISLFPDALPVTFLEEWTKRILERLEGLSAAESGYFGFRRLIEDTMEENYRIVILLDEFEAVIDNSNLDRGFFEFLRALTQNYDVSFILFSRSPLQHFLEVEKFISTGSSPFFNSLNISYLKFLGEEDARRLIEDPSRKAGVDITSFTDFILEQAYYHPFLLQQLSSIVFDSIRSSDIDRAKMLDEFRIQTEEFFTYLWQHSDQDEQEALRDLAGGNQDIPKITLDKLERRSLLKEGQIEIFCPLFGEFVRRLKR
jgi:hypothetical protein